MNCRSPSAPGVSVGSPRRSAYDLYQSGKPRESSGPASRRNRQSPGEQDLPTAWDHPDPLNAPGSNPGYSLPLDSAVSPEYGYGHFELHILFYSPPKTFPLRSFPIAAMNIAKTNTTVAVNAIADA
jgi:hypothetical protein